MTLDRREQSDEVARSMGHRLVLLAFAALVATIGIAFVVNGLRDSSDLRLLFGAVLTLLSAIWAAAASRSRPH
jgi:hypothetical protein